MTDAPATMPIGMFSRASSLSIKSLRAYHEDGILVPDSVDPRTGYRIYTVDQLADAAVIVRLRMLDVPLAQVREVLAARDPDTTKRVLAAHRTAMEDRLAETARIIAELQSGVAPTTMTPVHVRAEPARHTVRVLEDVHTAEFGEWLADAHGRLAAFLDRAGVEAAGPPGTLCGASIEDDGIEPVEAFIPVAEPVGGGGEIGVGEVPAARVAVLVHAGDYPAMIDTYRTLGAWVARNATHADERVREWCVVGALDGPDVATYRTEIAWPIA
jgi:DNA-binding transcriptional MerR regulator